jgi:hypothetical protein
MQQNSGPNANIELLIRKWEELKNLTFPESPGHPFLNNLYIELAEYDVYVCNIARSIIEKGEKVDRQLVRINEDWNEKLDSFDPDESGVNQEYNEMKQYKQVLDEFISLILKMG